MRYLLDLLIIVEVVLLLTIPSQAQYGMPPWPGPRAPMPMGPPQDWRRSPMNRDWYGHDDYDDGAGRWLYYPGPRDYLNADPYMPRRPFPPPPRGGYELRYPYPY